MKIDNIKSVKNEEEKNIVIQTQNSTDFSFIENRNPYHDYSQLETVRQRIEEVDEDIHRPDRELTGIYIHTKNFNPYFYLRDHGTNICRSKEDYIEKKVLYKPTEEETGELIEFKKEEDCKYSKKNILIKRKKYNPVLDEERKKWIYTCFKPVYRPITKDIQLIFEIYNDFRQVSTGLTHNQRQVIVCDFDEDYIEEIREENRVIQQSSYDYLVDFCKKNSFPVFTYLERHLDSNHYQVGWILDRPIEFDKYYTVFSDFDDEEISGKILFRMILKNMKDCFHSCSGFNGWHIKNPNYDNPDRPLTRTIWNNDSVSFVEFINAALNVDTSEHIEVSDDNSVVQENRKRMNPCEELSTGSRHMYMLKHLREYIFKFRRENKRFPTEQETLTKAHEIEIESLQETNKKRKRFDSEIKIDAKSILDWCKSKYKEVEYSSDRRNFALTVCSAYKQINVIKSHLYKKQEMKPKEIAVKLNTSLRSVRTYLKEEVDIEKVYSLKREVENFSERQSKKMKYYLEDCETALKLYEELLV